MCASFVFERVAGAGVVVATVGVVDCNDAALVILSTISFPTRSPVASVVFCSAHFEIVLNAPVADLFVSRSFWPYLMLRFLLSLFAKEKIHSS